MERVEQVVLLEGLVSMRVKKSVYINFGMGGVDIKGRVRRGLGGVDENIVSYRGSGNINTSSVIEKNITESQLVTVAQTDEGKSFHYWFN